MSTLSTETIDPLFLFSLPRSGSTLLQRMLASHSAISTAAEPWLLLPFLSATEPEGTFSTFGHRTSARAIRDLCDQLPNGRADYHDELRRFVKRLYRKLSDAEARYFLDKTPRYSLIADAVLDVFVDSPALVLWRNPLAIIASSIELWAGGRWAPHVIKVDLFDGLATLIDIYTRRSDRFDAVRYEDLVRNPQSTCERLLDALGLPWEPGVVNSFADTQLTGAMGDKRGVHLYDSVSAASVDRWKQTLASPVRKAWCRRYLRWLGDERLAIMGYDLADLLTELAAIPATMDTAAADVGQLARGVVSSIAEPRIMRSKLTRLPEFGRVYGLS